MYKQIYLCFLNNYSFEHYIRKSEKLFINYHINRVMTAFDVGICMAVNQ